MEQLPREDQLELTHGVLLSTMRDTALRLNGYNGELIHVARKNARGRFFYSELQHQTISELQLVEWHKDVVEVNDLVSTPERYFHDLVVETYHLPLKDEEKRLRYRLVAPGGGQYSIDINPTWNAQHKTTENVKPLVTWLNRFIEDFQRLERI